MVALVLLLAGAACFLLAAFNAVTKPNLLGLLVPLIDAVRAVA
jgi:hypothetical protein